MNKKRPVPYAAYEKRGQMIELLEGDVSRLTTENTRVVNHNADLADLVAKTQEDREEIGRENVRLIAEVQRIRRFAQSYVDALNQVVVEATHGSSTRRLGEIAHEAIHSDDPASDSGKQWTQEELDAADAKARELHAGINWGDTADSRQTPPKPECPPNIEFGEDELDVIPRHSSAKPWDYLEDEPAEDAPVSDNPSGLYCPSCRSVRAELGTGGNHCGQPEYCGGMRRMNPVDSEHKENDDANG